MASRCPEDDGRARCPSRVQVTRPPRSCQSRPTEKSDAPKFYEGTLGLKTVDEEGDEVIVFKSGDSVINVYRSEYAGTNKATAVTWSVDDLEGEVRTLKDKGVTFEHYDMPNMKVEGDIHVSGDMKVAWFKDPDGNILNIIKH